MKNKTLLDSILTNNWRNSLMIINHWRGDSGYMNCKKIHDWINYQIKWCSYKWNYGWVEVVSFGGVWLLLRLNDFSKCEGRSSNI